MKKTLLSLLPILTLAISVMTVDAQCTISTQGFPFNLNSVLITDNTGNNTDGQTFTACQTGEITSISINMDVVNLYQGTMNLWLSEEPGNSLKLDGLPVYQTFEVTAANFQGPVAINLDTPFPVINNNIYRLEFAPVGNGFAQGAPIVTARVDARNKGNNYSGGTWTQNGTYGTVQDLNFSMLIEPSSGEALDFDGSDDYVEAGMEIIETYHITQMNKVRLYLREFLDKQK